MENHMISESDDVTQLDFKLGLSKKSVKLLCDKKKVLVKSGKLRIPFGPKVNRFKTYSDFDEYYIDFSFLKEETGFEKFLSSLENAIKDQITLTDLFKETDDRESVERKFVSMMKAQNGYQPLIKVNLGRRTNGAFDFSVFDTEKTQLKVTDSNINDVLSKGSFCRVIFEVDKIYYFKETYGVVLKLYQLRFCEKPQEIKAPTANLQSESSPYSNCMFLEEDD